jgi:hypothetical protein
MLRLFSEKGFSIINSLLALAFLAAAFNLYSYFNPHFTLSKYSIVAFLSDYSNQVRKDDLKAISQSLQKYYRDHGSYPANIGWCGRIVQVLNPEAKDALSPYFKDSAIPQDPRYPGTNKDYFYAHEERDTYVLLATLEALPAGSPTYHYDDCIDWPGDNVFNYKVVGTP